MGGVDCLCHAGMGGRFPLELSSIYCLLWNESGVDSDTAQFLTVCLGISSDISTVDPETEGTPGVSGATGFSFRTGREQKKNVTSWEFKLRPTSKITDIPFEDFTGCVPVFVGM
ncbi:MAG: hypothetical protein K6E38_08730 [Fretibacterium sp.]|nr:hypothetical protein [Fretibacterium sp.]